jgi:ABC-type multidrug transport system ATPase subunit
VLDEPSIGLHTRDTGRLIRILHELREIGNTILVVEHDPDVMRAADHIVDLGPGAGEHGGEIVYEGSYPDLLRDRQSLTGRYLRGEMRVSIPRVRHAVPPAQAPAIFRSAPAQPEEHRRRNPAGRHGGGHRRFRFRQIHAGARRDLPLHASAAQSSPSTERDPLNAGRKPLEPAEAGLPQNRRRRAL